MADDAKVVRTRLGPQGRIVLPAHFRQTMGVEPGDALVVSLAGEGRVMIETVAASWARLQDEFRAAIPDGVDLVGELLAERRAEAAHQEAEALQYEVDTLRGELERRRASVPDQREP